MGAEAVLATLHTMCVFVCVCVCVRACVRACVGAVVLVLLGLSYGR